MKKGHTLLELVAVMVIMAIAYLTVYAVTTQTALNKIDAASAKVRADIYQAQSMAFNTGEWYGIRFNTGGNYYYVFKFDINTQTEFIVADQLTRADFSINIGQQYNGIMLDSVVCNGSSGTDYVLFRSDGTPCQKNQTPFVYDSQIILRSTGGSPFYRRITAKQQTGIVEMANI